MDIPKIRYMNEAYAAIKEADPDTVITYGRFRRDVIRGKIPSKKWGKRYLIDLADIPAYVSTFEAEDKDEEMYRKIRRIAE